MRQKRLQRSRLKQLSMRDTGSFMEEFTDIKILLHFIDEKIEEFRQKCLPEFNQKNAEGAALL